MTTISHDRLYQLNEFISSVTGLNFSEGRWPELERGIIAAARDSGFPDPLRFIDRLMSSPLTQATIETLASYLTIGETYFFREKITFDVLEGHILPELIHLKGREGKRLRIWSAGCSTGEEPYSIAILLNRMIFNPEEWNITILATDINPHFLKKGLAGIYKEWSFRDTPLWVKEGYFNKTEGGCYEIPPGIKKMVTFNYLNLAEDVYPSLLNNTNGMDLIFSRNVLMYFAPDSAKKVIGGFFNSLVDGGLLLISPAEGITVRSSQFIPVNFPGVTLYRKCPGRPREPYRHPEYGAGHAEQIYCHSEDSVSSDETQKEMQAGAHMPQRETGDNESVSPALLARTCANEGRFEEALKWCEKALSSDALNPANHYLCAAVLLEQGRIDEAVKSLKRALYLDHNFILAYFTLGNIMLNQGRADASGKYFENAVELLTTYNPDDVLPESDGMTAGRLLEIITVINSQ